MSEPTRTAAPFTASLTDTRPADAGGAPPSVPPGYDLGDEVGRGGMGVVYRARDRELNREVAVKLLQERYAPDSATARRFVEESQITSQLQHPGIPPVYRVGTLADGRPFLAMKLIKGQTLDALQKEWGAGDGSARWLGVFEDLCQAVGYAHAHGVIHRDLKPANVMVGAFGEVQVMDWGLAKLLANRGSAATGVPTDPDATATPDPTAIQSLRDADLLTQHGSILGTPAYMSPEQAVGSVEQIDRRTDVFGLGAILCTLLTGKPPFVGDTAESTRLLAARANLDAAHERLAGCGAEPDLIALCKRCLSAEKGDRPADAGAVAKLVHDLRAAADERARRAEIDREKAVVESREQRKRRRIFQWGSGVMVAVLALGVAGTSVGLLQAQAARVAEARRADGERAAKDEAVRQADLSRRGLDAGREAIDRAFTRVSENKLLTVPGLQPLRKELLEDARRFYQKFLDQWGDEPTLRVELAEATSRLAAVTSAIGSKDEAEALLRKAVEQLERVRGEPDAGERATRPLAAARMNLGVNLLAQQRHEEARAELERSLDLHRGLPRDADEEEEGEGTVRGNLAIALTGLRRFDEAEKNADLALAVTRGALGRRPDDPRKWHSAAGLLNTLGAIRIGQGRPADAEKLFREAADTERKAIAAAPTIADYQEWLGNHLFNLALLLEMHLNRPADALPVRKDALAVWEKLAKDNPAVVQYRLNVAIACRDIANTAYALTPAEDVSGWYERAVALLEQVVKDDPTSVRGHNALGGALDGLSEARYTRKDLAEAERLQLAAIRAQSKAIELAPGEEQCRRHMVTHHINLARLYVARKKPTEAVEAARTAVSHAERLVKLPGAGVQAEWKLVDAHGMLGRTLNAPGREREAAAAIDQILEVLARIHRQTPDDPKVAEDVNGWFTALADLRPDTAGEVRERQAGYWRKHADAHPDKLAPALCFAGACVARADLAYEQREWGTALEWFDRGRAEMAARRKAHPTDPDVAYLLGSCLKLSGDIHWQRKRRDQAAAAWDAAAAVFGKQVTVTPGETRIHHLLAGVLHNLGHVAFDEEKYEAALGHFTAAVEHQKRRYAENPDGVRRWLSNHYDFQATTLRQLGRWADAVAATRERAKLWAKDVGNLIECARAVAACVKAVANDPARKAEADGWAADAVGWLRTAAANGAPAKALAADEYLTPLREREDFKKLVASLAPREVLPPPRKE